MRPSIEPIVDHLRERWRGAPPITVVATAAALPFAAPPDTEAAYHRGQVLLVADALQPARAVEVLAHEAVAHHGLRQLLGRSWASFLGGVVDGARSDGFLHGARGHVERTYADDAGACTLTQRQVADEIAAAVAERRMCIVKMGLAVDQPLKKQALAVRGHLAREVLLLESPVCRDQLDGALLLAERRIRHGRAFFGWLARVADWYAGGMAKKPYDFTTPPMTMEQNKALIDGAKSRENFIGDLKMSGAAIVLLVSLVMIVVGLIAGLNGLLQGLRWLLH